MSEPDMILERYEVTEDGKMRVHGPTPQARGSAKTMPFMETNEQCPACEGPNGLQRVETTATVWCRYCHYQEYRDETHRADLAYEIAGAVWRDAFPSRGKSVFHIASVIRPRLSALQTLAAGWRLQNGDYPESKDDCADELLALIKSKPEAVRCPKCGGVNWYQVGNLLCCFPCAEGFIVAPNTQQNSPHVSREAC